MTADYPCQEPGWVYVPPPCRSPEDHDRYACGCSYVARLFDGTVSAQ